MLPYAYDHLRTRTGQRPIVPLVGRRALPGDGCQGVSWAIQSPAPIFLVRKRRIEAIGQEVGIRTGRWFPRPRR